MNDLLKRRSQQRVEICGGIASGKTTLARLLSAGERSTLIEEDFRANPFWRLAYEQPELYTLEKNICFLAQHTAAIKRSRDPLVVCDFSVVQDLAYASLQESAEHLEVMTALYQHLYLRLPPVSLVIFLKCDADTELARVRDRGRREEKRITRHFLERLDSGITKVLKGSFAPKRIHVIDSRALDFANDRSDIEQVREEVFALLAEPSRV